ncbi:MAG: hypothetical protein RQ745_06805 [Longimicrobiales bacterium]|nr:hypothetical protein [Longimicrobiales bacterium]
MNRSSSSSPSRRRISRALALYFAVVLSGYVARCDAFPLTWAPMYVAHHSADTYHLIAMDRSEIRERGFGVTRRDGSTGHLTHADLNIPFRNFWPIYAERAFGEGPPKHRRAVDEHGPYNTVEVDWPARIFETVNRTLGLDPDDPDYIVELRAGRRVLEFSNLHVRPTITGERLDSVTLRWTPDGVLTLRHETPLPELSEFAR